MASHMNSHECPLLDIPPTFCHVHYIVHAYLHVSLHRVRQDGNRNRRYRADKDARGQGCTWTWMHVDMDARGHGCTWTWMHVQLRSSTKHTTCSRRQIKNDELRLRSTLHKDCAAGLHTLSPFSKRDFPNCIAGKTLGIKYQENETVFAI
jgi:hypothetical protein